MAGPFFDGEFFQGGFFGEYSEEESEAVKTGGKGDNKARRKKLHLPFKPTGLVDRPVVARPSVKERLEQAAEIHREVLEEVEEATPVERMSLQEIEAEIGERLRAGLRKDDEEIIMLLLMAAHAS